ncbi:MAG: TetM/TetW/TetO/TetS family tetracycline resistance ribosomal protection protein [Actinomycetota bacterium]|nr:TetM/TetW/TetO/TetS family tetracycline resistance ribosomal protection protein [Actinomycetota bacterium]MDQ2846772.1 TetM/TetW/TetO/TetS family tetracycline resistance ribosomal protection protein [Actinomycetota bacterium]MDQ2958211.1 TetM/TetW/TetO/TetS family tetracycline resistance ribosomal protection protein [Actinomycetota bacterium]
MHSLNLGILAHVDAGKTSLTERLLFDAGVLDAPGSVDAGTTRTDSMELERRRGITIRSAVTSFAIGEVAVNVIDTPGHPDFIAEVERALAVMDGAVLVLSAVEGVQAQSVVIWRALRRLEVPAIVFINKVDRAAADPARVLAEVRQRLGSGALALTAVQDAGCSSATVRLLAPESPDVIEALAELDERTLDAWAAGRPARRREAVRALRGGVRDGRITPVLAGSALTGVGVPELTSAIASYLPWASVDAGAEPAGVVFKIDRDEHGKQVYVRMRAGTLAIRDRLALSGRGPQRLTSLRVHAAGGLSDAKTVVGGQIAVIGGPKAVRIGDIFGQRRDGGEYRFAPALLESVIEPLRPEQRGALFSALTELAEQDPLIALRSDADSNEIAVSLYGEVQKEVITSLLAEGYGIEVRFRQTTVVCVERLRGSGSAVELIGTGGNPYLATIGLRVEASPPGSGVRFALGVERGAMPPAFFTATEEGVRAALRQGLFGWQITDCLITMTHSAYCPRQSHAHQPFNKNVSSVGADFRSLAPVVLMAALRKAGTQVCQPINRFELEVPSGALSSVLSALGRLGGTALSTGPSSRHTAIIGTIPAANIPTLTARLPGLTHGEGVFTSELDHYGPVPDTPPVRPRVGFDPGDRELWFREVPR